MTIIAYTPGMLAADSRAVCKPEELGEMSVLSTQVRCKLRLLAGERIAVANCGPIYTEEDWAELERILLHYLMILEEFEPEKNTIEFEEPHDEAAVLRDRFLLVMTRRHIYIIARETSDKSTPVQGLLRMDPSENFAYGSGASIAYVAFAAGMDAQKTAEFVIEQDALTGPPVVVAEQAKMRPMIVVRRPSKTKVAA